MLTPSLAAGGGGGVGFHYLVPFSYLRAWAEGTVPWTRLLAVNSTLSSLPTLVFPGRKRGSCWLGKEGTSPGCRAAHRAPLKCYRAARGTEPASRSVPVRDAPAWPAFCCRVRQAKAWLGGPSVP